MTDQGTALQMFGVSAGYYEHTSVIEDIELQARTGKVTVLLGPNGSGKSTTLRVLFGLLPARTGRIEMDGMDITHVPVHHRIRLRMAFLPQGRSVFPGLSVAENLEVGAWAPLGKDRKLRSESLQKILELYPSLKPLSAKPAGLLSGGQQRLLEIARMMIADPKIILIDEPSAGLAPVMADQIYEEVRRLRSQRRTIVLVDQNVESAIELADYVYTLEGGRNHLRGDTHRFVGELDALVKGWLRL